jgi:hypothetical protein
LTGKLLFAWGWGGQSRCLHTKLLFLLVSYFLPGGSRDVFIRSYFFEKRKRKQKYELTMVAAAAVATEVVKVTFSPFAWQVSLLVR